MIDEDDDFKMKLSFELFEEIEYFLYNYFSFMYSRKEGGFRFICRKYRLIRELFLKRNGSQLYLDEDKVKNELVFEKGRRVFCDLFSFDDYSYNLDLFGFDLDFYSLIEGSMYDSLYVFKKVIIWSNLFDLIDGDYIDVMVNDIVCYYVNII